MKPIKSFGYEEFSFGQEYRLLCWKIPEDTLCDDARIPEGVDLSDLGLPFESGFLYCKVMCGGDDENLEYVGFAEFCADLSSVVCSNIEIQPEFRRRGIATDLYDFAEGTFGVEVSPAPVADQSVYARSFWAARISRKLANPSP